MGLLWASTNGLLASWNHWILLGGTRKGGNWSSTNIIVFLRLLTSYSPVCFSIVVARHMGNSVMASNFWTCSLATHVERVLGCWWIVLDRQLNKLSEQVQTVQSLHPYQPIAPLERVDVQCILGTKTVPTWFAGKLPIYRGFCQLYCIGCHRRVSLCINQYPIQIPKKNIHEISPLYSH